MDVKLSRITSTSTLFGSDVKEDILHVTDLTEKILKCLTFKILDKIIDEEAQNGQFDISLIPGNILNELHAAKCHHAKDCEIGKGNDLDQWFMIRMEKLINVQADYAVRNHHQRFHRITAQLKLDHEIPFAYNTFVKICKKLFDEEISWHRILALICFGAEIGVSIIKHGRPGVEKFLNKVVYYVVEFTVKEEIAHWISQHGGWMAIVDLFDSENCPERANHILTVMAFSEVTNLEVWMKRIVAVAAITGILFTVQKIMFHR